MICFFGLSYKYIHTTPNGCRLGHPHQVEVSCWGFPSGWKWLFRNQSRKSEMYINRDQRKSQKMLKCFWFTALIHYLVRWQLQELLWKIHGSTTFTNPKIQQIHWFTQGWLPYLCLRRLGCDEKLRSWDECLRRPRGFVFLKITLKRKFRYLKWWCLFAQPVLVMSSGWHSWQTLYIVLYMLYYPCSSTRTIGFD